MNELASVVFSRWFPWKMRSEIVGSELPGVYMLARFKREPKNPPKLDALPEEIVYLGETTLSTLEGRWSQFDRTAFHGRRRHSGGRTYRAIFGNSPDKLYVSGYAPRGIEAGLLPAFIKYLERKLIWEFARRWGRSPLCNKR